MIKLDKKCYMILDLDAGEIVTTYKTKYRCIFKAIYDSIKGAKLALNTIIEYRKYKGEETHEYKIVEVVGVEVVDDDK